MTTPRTENVDLTDPHLDQQAAHARDDLDRHIASAANTAQDADDTAAFIVIAETLCTSTREHLAAMLAAALLRLAKETP